MQVRGQAKEASWLESLIQRDEKKEAPSQLDAQASGRCRAGETTPKGKRCVASDY
jgi:hypothetical protein